MNNQIRLMGLFVVGMLLLWGSAAVSAQTINAPSNLNYSLNVTTTTLTWTDNNTNETGFQIERSADNGATWTIIASTSANIVTYSDNTLACYSSYSYRVRTYRYVYPTGYIYSSYSNVVSVITGACNPLIAPTNLNLNLNSATIELSWDDVNANNTYAYIERSEDYGLTWSEIGSNPASYTYTYDQDLICGRVYSYRVREYRQSDNSFSEYSDMASIASYDCANPLTEEVCTFTPVTSPSLMPSAIQMSGNGQRGFIQVGDGSSGGFSETVRRDIEVWDLASLTIIDTIPDAGKFVVSTDGSRVFFVSNNDFTGENSLLEEQIFLWDDGTISQLTANNGDYNYQSLSINSNGTKLAFVLLDYSLGYLNESDRIIIWEEAQGFQDILPTVVIVGTATLSGDGNKIAFVSYDNLTGEDPAHTGYFYFWDEVNGVTAIGYPVSLDSYIPRAVWKYFDLELNEDASRLVFNIIPDNGGYPNGIYYWNQTEGFVDLTLAHVSVYNLFLIWHDRYAGVSADGQRILLVSSHDLTGENPDATISTSGYGNGEFYFADNGVLRQITSTLLLDKQPNIFAMSDDGSRILIYSMYPSQTTSVDSSPYVVLGNCEPLPLGTPTGLASDNPTASSISLSWNDVVYGETEYRLERSTDGITWTEISQPAANSTNYSDTGLSCNTSYQYRLRAYRSADTSYSSYSNIATGTTSACPPPPAAPTGLNVSATTQTSIDLIWTDNASDETEYRLERSTDGITWTEIAQPAANTTSYSDTGLTCNTSYQYRVRAYRSGDNSYSNYSGIVIVQSQSCDGSVNITCILQQFSAANDISEQAGLFYFSGDGSRLAITYAGNGTNPEGLNLYDVATGNLLVNIPNAGFADIDYDGNTLAFISTGNYSGQNADASEEIFLWSNGSFTQLTNVTADAYFFEVKISDDASTVVFAANGLVIGESAGTQYVYIWDVVNGIRKLIDVDGAVGEVAISGDGSSVAFLHSADLNGHDVTGFGLYVWNAVDGIDLVYGGFDYSNLLIYTLVMNADGSRLAFSSNIALSDLNYDGSLEVFLWDATTGLQQLSDVNELDAAYPFAIDASGQRVLLTRIAFDPANPDPQGSSYYLYDEDNGYSQVYFVPNSNMFWPTIWGTTLSSDGSKMALQIPVGWDGVSNVNPYLKVFIASCTPPPPLTAPLAPTSLQFVSTSETSISLAWRDNTISESQYRLERSSDAGTTWTEIAQLAPNSTSYSDIGLTCNTSYQYRVRAYRSADTSYSSYSNVVTATTSACPPAAPTGLNLTSASETSISLAWTDNATDESEYRIERSSNAGTTWTEIAQIAANSTSYSDTALLCGTSYQYRLRAYRSGDNQYSDYSNILTVSTSACPPPPAAPTGLNLTSVSETSISLSWTDNASDETGYRVERSSNSGTSWTEVAVLAANSTNYTDSALSCGTSYQYRVRVYRNADNQFSDYSNVLSSSTSLCPPPNAPTALTSPSKGQTSINLAWTDNASNETGYRVERSSDNGATWTEIAQPAANATTYSNTDLSCGTSYQYRLRAYRSGDNQYSDYSNVLTVSTNACPAPTAPTGLASTGTTTNSISLSWTDNASNETEYRLERLSGAIWSELAQLPANSTSYTDTGLNCYTLYSYRVRAYRSGDNQYSSYSNSISVRSTSCPVLAAPTSLTVTDRQQTTISLSWVDNATGETSYRIAQLINSSWTDIATLPADTTSYTLTGLNCSGSYIFVVRAYQNGGNNNYSSNSGNVQPTTLDCTGLTAPTLTPYTRTSYTITYNWTDNATIETAYYVEKRISGVWTVISTLPADSGSYTDSTVACDTSYFYRVRAYDAVSGNYSFYAADGVNKTSAYCPPSNVQASNITQTSLTLSWTSNTSPTYYNIDKTISGQNNWTWFGHVAGTVTTVNSTGLSCGTSYDYRVYAQDGSATNRSDYATLTVSTAACPAPIAPTGLTSTSISQTSINLSWTDNMTTETGYRVERSDDGITWNEVAQLAANSTSYSNTGLSCATTYDYRVRAYRSNDNQYSAYSNVISRTTSACPPPTAPSSLSVTGTSQIGISLSWTDNASNESSYSLERSTDGVTWTEVATPAANSTVYTDTGLSCNTAYQYRLRAYRSAENQYSSYSNTATGTTSACPPPTAPTGLVVTGTAHTNIALAWADNAGDETGYRVERSSDSGSTWTEIATPAANATSYNDTSAACNTTYDYRVRAYRSGDNQYSAYSNVVSASTDVCITLNAPTNIQQTANSQTGMSLSWTDNSSNESGYEIERSLDGTSWTLLSSLPADSTSYSDSGLSCATSYYYRIRSNHLGTGAYSSYGTSGALATAACPALIASVLSSTGSSASSIGLSWTVDPNATSFTLAYYNGTSWVNLGIFPATTTTYTHNSLACGTSYQYHITSFRSVDSASITSDAFSTSTSACPPLAVPNAPVVLNTEPALVSLQIPAKPATATSMSLERSSDGSIWTSLGNLTGNSYIDTAVVCGSSYQYRLVALRSSDSVTSTSATAIALTDACPIPTVLGTYRAGLWTFVASNNTAMPVNSFNFGDSSWQALVGDWDGDGVDGVGLYRNGEFVLKNTASADAPENRFNFGNAEAGWQALVGDWDGNGTDTVGLYKDGLFLISNDNVNIQYRFNFGNGQVGWQAIAGDWNGDGQDGIGLYQNGYWALADNVSNPDGSRQNINYGPSQAGWLAIVGDWNGDGYDSIGLYKEGIWRMRTNSVNDASESSLNFGQTADIPLAIFEN